VIKEKTETWKKCAEAKIKNLARNQGY